MNSTQIKCFLALSETLNFTKAASRLYLTQPALSRQIVTLEQELNTLLFIRDSKNVSLTPAGALLSSELGAFTRRWRRWSPGCRRWGRATAVCSPWAYWRASGWGTP